MMLHPPPGTPMTNPVSTPAPPPINKIGGWVPKAMTKPCPSPACDLSNVQAHASQICLDFPLLHTHMCIVAKTNDILVLNVPALPTMKNNSL